MKTLEYTPTNPHSFRPPLADISFTGLMFIFYKPVIREVG